MDEQCKLFVGGIIKSATSSEIRRYFSKFGAVKDVEIKVDGSGMSRGFAFVEMETPGEADYALSQSIHMFDGHVMEVKRMLKQNKKENKIFVGGITHNTTEKMLKDHFSPFGKVLEAKIRRDIAGLPRGFGFVLFSSVDEVNAAARDSHMIDGRTVEVRPLWKDFREKQERVSNVGSRRESTGSKKESANRVFVGGLKTTTTVETMKEYFSQFGTVTDARIKHDSMSGRSRGFGFIAFATDRDLTAVMDARPHTIDDKAVDVRRVQLSSKPEDCAPVKSLFVGGLKGQHTEENIREYFEKFGNIVQINIPKPAHDDVRSRNDRVKHRGFCFVDFDDYDPVDKVVLQKVHIIEGVNVDVRKGLSRDDRAKIEQTKREREMRDQRSGMGSSGGSIMSNGGDSGVNRSILPAPGYSSYNLSSGSGPITSSYSEVSSGSSYGLSSGSSYGSVAGIAAQYGSLASGSSYSRMGSSYGSDLPSSFNPYETAGSGYSGNLSGGSNMSMFSSGFSTATPTQIPPPSLPALATSAGLVGSVFSRPPPTTALPTIGSVPPPTSVVSPPQVAPPPGRLVPKAVAIKGSQFRAILAKGEVSLEAISILESQKLMDSNLLLSLTTEEFKELPMALGDRKRIENVLKENFVPSA